MPTNTITAEPAKHHINWGGVLKNAAIVTGVVVAAVAGAWLIGYVIAPYVTTAIAANPGLGELAAGIQHGAEWLIGEIGENIRWLADIIPKGIASIFGLTGQKFVEGAAVNHLATLGGGLTVGLAAVHGAMPHLEPMHYVDTGASVHADTDMLTSTLPMHDVTHMTHHAAEHASEAAPEHTDTTWSDKIVPRPTISSFADAARTQKEMRKVVQPADSFAEQLNTDRVNLDAALAK